MLPWAEECISILWWAVRSAWPDVGGQASWRASTVTEAARYQTLFGSLYFSQTFHACSFWFIFWVGRLAQLIPAVPRFMLGKISGLGNGLGLPLLLTGTICSLTSFHLQNHTLGFPHLQPCIGCPVCLLGQTLWWIVQEMFWMLCPKPWCKRSIAGGRSSGWEALMLWGVQGAGARKQQSPIFLNRQHLQPYWQRLTHSRSKFNMHERTLVLPQWRA